MWKKILKIPMFGWKRSEFKSLEGIGQNLMFGKIRSKFQ